MKKELTKHKFSIDYGGWEQVDFKEMTWEFNPDDEIPDTRSIKRINKVWYLESDSGSFERYDESNECVIEMYYQEYKKNIKKEKILNFLKSCN